MIKNTMENSYFAFISYAREDKDVANWLHAKLEKYPYPRELVKAENRPMHDRLVRRIFIDTQDLPVGTDKFSADIKDALKNSRYLIVICSENSATSIYVDAEISCFLETHGNDKSLILPVFRDKMENTLPESLRNSGITDRNCPIYISGMDNKSEPNQYCFYHIAAFLLKVDFSLLYNRYKRYSRRKHKRKIASLSVLIVMLLLIIFFLLASLNRQKELTKFEKDIFPLSIVFGYNNNFLIPLIEYLKVNNEDAEIYIMMPYRIEDLQHLDRIEEMNRMIKYELQADSIYSENLRTRVKRGTKIGRIASEYADFENVYVDFASTTSTFAQIIDYKKSRYDIDEDLLVKEYSDTFIRQSKELLGQDSIFVHYYTDRQEFISAIKSKVNLTGNE